MIVKHLMVSFFELTNEIDENLRIGSPLDDHPSQHRVFVNSSYHREVLTTEGCLAHARYSKLTPGPFLCERGL